MKVARAVELSPIHFKFTVYRNSLHVFLYQGYDILRRHLRNWSHWQPHCLRSHREECIDAHGNKLLSLQSRRFGFIVSNDG